MYESLTPDDEGLADLLAGRDPALDHRGDYERPLRVHARHVAAARASPGDVPPVGPYLLRRMTDARVLRSAAAALRRRGPKAPGPGGLRLERLGDGETWGLCRALSEVLRAGTYRPGPVQEVRIPKEHRPGETRRLTVQSAPDRVVAKAAALVLGIVVEPSYSPFSFGFRTRVGPQHALATFLALHDAGYGAFPLVADVANAFDRVPLARLLDACRRHVPADVVEYVRLLSDTGKRSGIRQGSPLSPMLFNVFADHFLDRPWHRRHPDLPLIRYADDLLVTCRSAAAAEASAVELSELARLAGTPLKAVAGNAGGGVTIDLAGGQLLEWLGFDLRQEQGGMAVRIGQRAWDRLAWRFAKAHLGDAAPLGAVHIALGWVSAMGPCYASEDRDRTVRRLRRTAAAYAFDEIPGRRELLNHWRAAHARWHRTRGREAALLADRLRSLGGRP